VQKKKTLINNGKKKKSELNGITCIRCGTSNVETVETFFWHSSMNGRKKGEMKEKNPPYRTCPCQLSNVQLFIGNNNAVHNYFPSAISYHQTPLPTRPFSRAYKILIFL